MTLRIWRTKLWLSCWTDEVCFYILPALALVVAAHDAGLVLRWGNAVASLEYRP